MESEFSLRKQYYNNKIALFLSKKKKKNKNVGCKLLFNYNIYACLICGLPQGKSFLQRIPFFSVFGSGHSVPTRATSLSHAKRSVPQYYRYWLTINIYCKCLSKWDWYKLRPVIHLWQLLFHSICFMFTLKKR